MLNVKPFKQSSGFCGPASLKMVLDYYGIKKTEKELAKLAGAKKHTGVGAEGLIKAAKELGFKGFFKDFSDVEDLKHYVIDKKIPVIVDWFSSTDGHYSTVVNIDKNNIYLQDPELGNLRIIDIPTFKRIWFDFSGDLLQSKDQIIIRRMIVMYKCSHFHHKFSNCVFCDTLEN